jgi:xanthine dehydrogenase accessory factor
LLVFGAVDTAEALCAASKQLGWLTIVADARRRFATRERLPSADEIVVAWPAEALAQVQPDARTAVVVLTQTRNSICRRCRTRSGGSIHVEPPEVSLPA